MTSKQKVRTLIALAIGIFFGLGILTNYIFPHDIFVSFLSFIVSVWVIIWLFIKIRTKEEIKEYESLHWTAFNLFARLFGVLLFIAGILCLLRIFNIPGQILLDSGEKWIYLIIALFAIPLGYAFLVVKEYRPKSMIPDENTILSQHERIDPLRKMIEKRDKK